MEGGGKGWGEVGLVVGEGDFVIGCATEKDDDDDVSAAASGGDAEGEGGKLCRVDGAAELS